ncbi:hypothetical protein R6Q57_005807 [Mikania cordata]
MQPCFQESAPQFQNEPDFVSNDVVLETQEPQKRKKKGKRAKDVETGGSSGSMAPKPWTHDEETALGRCYIDHSENKSKGNSQKRENFWKKLIGSWHEMMGYTDQECRTYHQLNSKLKDMSTKVMRFIGIYSNRVNNRKSGMNDESLLKWAEKEYQMKSPLKRYERRRSLMTRIGNDIFWSHGRFICIAYLFRP